MATTLSPFENLRTRLEQSLTSHIAFENAVRSSGFSITEALVAAASGVDLSSSQDGDQEKALLPATVSDVAYFVNAGGHAPYHDDRGEMQFGPCIMVDIGQARSDGMSMSTYCSQFISRTGTGHETLDVMCTDAIAILNELGVTPDPRMRHLSHRNLKTA